MARDLNRVNLALTGALPMTTGPGSVNREPPRNNPPLTSLRNRGAPGRDKALQRFDVDLATARTKANPMRLGAMGNRLAVMRTTFDTDAIEIRFDGRDPWVPFGAGSELGGQPFTFIEVANDSVAGSTVVLLSGTEYPGDPLYFRQR